MKKYLLITLLFIFVFLGLGNVSFGQGTEINGLQSNGTDPFGSVGGTSNTPTNPNAGTTPTLMDENQTNGQPTVTPGITPGGGTGNCTVVGLNEEIINDPNAINDTTALGCTCKDGYKEVNSKCEPCNKKGICCGVELSTNVPFIGKCLEETTGDIGVGESDVTGNQAFPVLMSSLTQILVTIILILSFVLIVVGGIMIATGNPSGGKKLIIKVVIGIALLGASGVILRLINPNFFG